MGKSSKTQINSIHIHVAEIYIITHCPGLVQAFQNKGTRLMNVREHRWGGQSKMVPNHNLLASFGVYY